MSQTIIAIIPARGGSKGIPQKNVIPIQGRPLLVHTIEDASGSPSISRVIVSTDDREIGAIAAGSGAEVVWRPAAISSDRSSSEAALLHVLDHLRDTEGLEPELVVFLQATSPIRGKDDIEEAIATLRRDRADSLFSARAIHGFVWRLAPDRLEPINYDPLRRPMRQDLGESILEENGSIYVFRPAILRAHGSRLGGRIAVYLQGPCESLQVDEPADLEAIRRLMDARSTRRGDPGLARVRLLVLDFDGVMTDDRVLVSQDGAEAVFCKRSDGWGLQRLREGGVGVLVLSAETNPVVQARCRKLGVECVQGIKDKEETLRALAVRHGLGPAEVAYVGNDVNDAGCLRWAGVPIVVADAAPEIRPLARLVTRLPGGAGAVREVADWILAARADLQRGK
jgi:N-acylneuraminate cytidylyltransferase